MSYTVKYHPEGWRSAKDELPEKSGEYIVAVRDMNPTLICDCSYVDVLYYHADTKLWVSSGVHFNALLPDVPDGSAKLVAWQPFPTPPWEIFPKEITDA